MTADTCHEVVLASSGRIVQTIQHQKSSNDTVSSTTRDASGRIIGTATSHPSADGKTTRTDYRDASGRVAGSADTHAAGIVFDLGGGERVNDAVGLLLLEAQDRGDQRVGAAGGDHEDLWAFSGLRNNLKADDLDSRPAS